MPKPRTAEVVIFTGDYLDRIRYTERKHAAAQATLAAAEDAEEATVRRVGESSPATALRNEVSRLAAEHDALVEEAEREAIRVRVTTVRRRKYREIVDAHPPREGNKGDETLGVNQATFREVLVPEAMVEVTEADETRAWSDYSEDERDEFLDTLAEADMERLFGTAYSLVNGFTADPKMLASHSSQQTQASGEN